MSPWVLRVVVLAAGFGVLRSAPDPWSYAGAALVAWVVLDVLHVGRRPVTTPSPEEPQDVTVVQCGLRPIDVIKVLREYLEPDPGAVALEARLAATPSHVGRVTSAAAAEELSGRLEPLGTLVTFRPAG